jgi:RNA polymerase sigma-B factor
VRVKTRPNLADDRRLFMRYYVDGDVAAREQLIRRCLPLAQRMASRYSRSGEPADDLLQVASIGLIKAVDRFDPTRGTAFSSFAVPCILGELKRHFRDHGWAAHVPRSVQERALKVTVMVDKLTAQYGRAPTTREIALATGSSVEQVLEATYAASTFGCTSLDAPPLNGDDGGTLAFLDTLGHEDERYELVEYRSAIASTMRAIPKRELLVLALRFDQDMTQSEIASRIGISQMHVSRLIRRALDRLRAVAEADRNAGLRRPPACSSQATAYAQSHDI